MPGNRYWMTGALIAGLMFMSATSTEDPLVQGAQQLADQITATYKFPSASQKPKIAVLEFSDLDGHVTDFGRLLSEELITRLFLTQRFDVVERLMLSKIIREHKLQMEGIVDPDSAKELGKILGVEAIVSGTHAQTTEGLRINARVVSTETGSVFAVASTTVISQRQATSAAYTDASTGTDALLRPSAVYTEDFSGVAVGLLPGGWQAQDEVMVGKLRDGSKALWANANGNYKVVVPTPTFPDDFRLSLRLRARHWIGWHEEGQPLVVTAGTLVFTFRATGTVLFRNTSGSFPSVTDQISTLAIEKQGTVVRYKVNGTEALVLRITDFKPPTGFTIQWQRHTDEKNAGGTDLAIYEVRLERL